MPTNFDALTIEATASTATDALYDYDGTNGRLLSVNGKATPFLLGQAPERAAPTTAVSCGANTGCFWFDSTNHIPSFKDNNSSTVSSTVVPATCTNQFINAVTATGSVTCSGANFQVNSSGLFTTIDGITTVGTGAPILGWLSNVTAQSTSQSAVTLATAPTGGMYRLEYYGDQNALCTTGSNSVAFTFNWSDGSNARALSTGALSLLTAQQTSSFISGQENIFIGSGNVTYTSTVTGTCATGTSSYDIHATLERLQ